jgi:hypothetical protein
MDVVPVGMWRQPRNNLGASVMTIEQIAEATGLTAEEIEGL